MLDKRGQAVLLDALIFLTVAAIVSVSIVAATSDRYQEEDADLRDYAARAHEVILRTTVQKECAVENGSEWLSIRDLAIAYFLTVKEGRDLGEYEGALENATILIEGLIPSWANFTWTVIVGPDELLIGEAPLDAECVWPSLIYSEMPEAGGQLIFKLEIWR